MWKLRIGIAALVGVNLAVQVGVMIVLRRTDPIFSSALHEQLSYASSMLFGVQLATSLFCLSYARFDSPWRELGCTAWVVAAALLYELAPYRERQGISWDLISSVTCLWTGYAFLILGRWHFGTEFASGAAAKTPRRSLYLPATYVQWLLILGVCGVGCLLFTFLPRSRGAGETFGISTAFAWAFVQCAFRFPLLAAALARSFGWLLNTVLYGLIAIFVLLYYEFMSYSNPPQADIDFKYQLLTIIPIAFNALAMRLFGLRWQASEPWPASIRPTVLSTPDPFA